METIRGNTAIDTLYELKGLQLAGAFYENLFLVAVAVCIGFGIIHALYQAADTSRYRTLVVYIAQAFIVLFLIQPVMVNVALPAGFVLEGDLEGFIRPDQPSIQAPRFLVWSHIAIDSLGRVLTRAVNASFAERPHEVERLALLLRKARIEDGDLRRRYQAFLVSCYLPAWTNAGRAGTDSNAYYDPFAVPDQAYAGFQPYTPEGQLANEHMNPLRTNGIVQCADAKKAIYEDLRKYVADDPDWAYDEVKKTFRRLLKDDYGKKGISKDWVGDASPVILRYVLYNETLGLMSTSEIADLAAAVPEYGMFHTSQQTASNPQGFIDWARSIVSFFVKIGQSVDQWIDHHAEGPALYYKVVCYAPYVYGITSMILLSIFPFAAFAALLPSRWGALLLWCKYFLWVKLWIVFWAILARFNTWRNSLEDIGSDPSNGIGDQTYIFPAIAAMYLVTPALSLVVVQLVSIAAKGASNAVGSIVPGSAGAHVSLPSPSGNSGGGGGGGGTPAGGGAGGGAGAEAGAAVPPPI